MAEGSSGGQHPAWPRVCTGQGLEPSSNSAFAKSPGGVESCLISSGVNALRSRVRDAIVPPKCCQFVEGRAGGAISRTGLMLPTSSLPLATLAPSTKRVNSFPLKVAARKCQVPGARDAEAERLLSLPIESSTWPLSSEMPRKNSSEGSPTPAITVDALGESTGFTQA